MEGNCYRSYCENCQDLLPPESMYCPNCSTPRPLTPTSPLGPRTLATRFRDTFRIYWAGFLNPNWYHWILLTLCAIWIMTLGVLEVIFGTEVIWPDESSSFYRAEDIVVRLLGVGLIAFSLAIFPLRNWAFVGRRPEEFPLVIIWKPPSFSHQEASWPTKSGT